MTKQNTKLSGYNPNRQPASIPSYLGLPRISGWKKFANLFKPDTPNKLKCNCLCTGRSMVEMLGVLAIIGVLSVGAIAGYSKAMMKYRLNKHAEAVNMLINNMLSLKNKLPHDNDKLTDYATILNKLNMLPDGIQQESENYLRDKYMHNSIRVYYQGIGSYKFTGIIFWIGNSGSEYTIESCYNILKVAKENSANIDWVRSQKVNTDGSSDASVNLFDLYGDNKCTGSRQCLRNLNINALEKACQSCKDGACSLAILY